MLKVLFIYIFAIIFIGLPILNSGKGNDVNPDEFPYIVSFRTFKTHICGATVLTPKHLLTAAHCVEWSLDNPTAFSVQFGMVKTFVNDDNSITVSKVVKENRYPRENKYDVAVITLESEIPIDENQTIEYHRSVFNLDQKTEKEDGEEGEEEEEKYEVKFVGWGVNSAANERTPLQSIDFELLSDTECKKVDEENIDINYHLCAKVEVGEGIDCNSYSGSPLFNVTTSKIVQLGIASWVSEKIGCIVVFSNVKQHNIFINTNLNEHSIN